jgi:peptidoglycan/xylan/chitin deacetylase (PgdA/CDA1 family)
MSFGLFERQVNYLRKNYDIISLPYLLDCLKNGYRLDPLSALITFDDGYKNIRHIVWPYLNSLEIPFSAFISTRHIDEGLRFPTYYLRAALLFTERQSIRIASLDQSFDLSTRDKRIETKIRLEAMLKRSPQRIVNQIVNTLKASIPEERWAEINDRFSSDQPMSWDEVRQLADNGVAIGSHFHDHLIPHSQQKRSEISSQIATSKELIEKKLGNCAYLSYPEGGSCGLDGGVIEALASSRYELGFTCISGEIHSGLNRFILPRLGNPFQFDRFVFGLNTSFLLNRHYRKWSQEFFRGRENQMNRSPECH